MLSGVRNSHTLLPAGAGWKSTATAITARRTPPPTVASRAPVEVRGDAARDDDDRTARLSKREELSQAAQAFFDTSCLVCSCMEGDLCGRTAAS